MGPDPVGEFGLIAWIRERSNSGGRVGLGIGDDCAGLTFTPGREVLVTTDLLMDGRHFLLAEAGAEAVGHKALGVNLSDIAAMAGVPVAAFVAVALPKGSAAGVAKWLHAGMAPLLDRFGVVLAGGDTNAWDGPLVVCVTLIGEATARGAVRRSGAKVGDAVLVTGPLGGSRRGRHLRPEPRIAEALALAEAADLHAMIDLSDGLLADLGHILEESGGLGATLDAASVPIHPDAFALGGDPLGRALGDGEDFELCFTLAPEDADRLLASPPGGVALHRVGTIDAEPRLRLRHPDGRVEGQAARGFDHLAPEA